MTGGSVSGPRLAAERSGDGPLVLAPGFPLVVRGLEDPETSAYFRRRGLGRREVARRASHGAGAFGR